MSPVFQLATKLWVVEDLTVEGDDDLTALVGHGLRATSSVDDAESYMREADALSDVKTVSIRTAMANRGRHATQ